MGLGDAIDSGLAAVGDGLRANTDLVGHGLEAVGWDSGAEFVRDGGEWLSDKAGSQVPERELGETDEAGELIHGSPGDLNETVKHLKDFAKAFETTGQALRKLDTEHWKGSAADRFRETFTGHPQRWLKAADSCTDAAEALDAYASTVTWAREQASAALERWKAAEQAGEAARRAYNQQVDDYDVAAYAYNMKAQSGTDPGKQPAKPGKFVDPAEPDRQAAREILAEARRQRTDAAGTAQRKITAATEDAPATPDFADRFSANTTDAMSAQVVNAEHVAGGFAKGAASTLRMARMVNPTDVYNLTHPAEYATNLATMGLGMVSAANHPVRTVKGIVGSGWSKDPHEAAGTLGFDIVLDVLTGGAGAGASAARRTAHVAENAAEQGAERAMRDTAKDAAEHADDAVDASRHADEVDAHGDDATGHADDASGPNRDLDPDDPRSLPAAVDKNVDVDGMNHKPVWREDHEPLYRNDNRHPEEIFEQGFHPRDSSNTDLFGYVEGNQASAFVGTTTNPDANWLTNYRYEVDAPGGIDVNETLPNNKYRDIDQEVAFAGGIDRRHIRGAWELLPDGSKGEWVANPHFEPQPRPDKPATPDPQPPSANPLPEGWTL